MNSSLDSFNEIESSEKVHLKHSSQNPKRNNNFYKHQKNSSDSFQEKNLIKNDSFPSSLNIKKYKNINNKNLAKKQNPIHYLSHWSTSSTDGFLNQPKYLTLKKSLSVKSKIEKSTINSNITNNIPDSKYTLVEKIILELCL